MAKTKSQGITMKVDSHLEDELNNTLTDADVKRAVKDISKKFINDPLGTLKKYCKRKDIDTDLLYAIKKYTDEAIEKNKEKRAKQIQAKIDVLQNELNALMNF